jgi:hypothetical protein
MNNSIKLAITVMVSTWLVLALLTILIFKHSDILHQQAAIIISQSHRISQLETNQVQMIGTWDKMSKETDQYNDLLITKVKQADDILDKKIERLASDDVFMVERLKAISEAQNAVVRAIIGLSVTNSVDK